MITGARTWDGDRAKAQRIFGMLCNDWKDSSVGKLVSCYILSAITAGGTRRRFDWITLSASLVFATLRNGFGSCVSYPQCSNQSLIARLRSLQVQRTPEATLKSIHMMYALYRVAGGSRATMLNAV